MFRLLSLSGRAALERDGRCYDLASLTATTVLPIR